MEAFSFCSKRRRKKKKKELNFVEGRKPKKKIFFFLFSTFAEEEINSSLYTGVEAMVELLFLAPAIEKTF
jgi:hypothetical protein